MQSSKTERGQQRLRVDADALWRSDQSLVPNIAVKSDCRVLTQSPVCGRLNWIKLQQGFKNSSALRGELSGSFCNHQSLTRQDKTRMKMFSSEFVWPGHCYFNATRYSVLTVKMHSFNM